MFGLFNIKFQIILCLQILNCSKLDLSSLRTALFARFIKKTFITSFMIAPMRSPFGTCSLNIWWSDLRAENLRLSLTDVIVGFFDRNDLLNYLIILGKLSIWECRRNKSLPKFHLFLHKVEAKKETEKLIALRNKKFLDFKKRWEPLLYILETTRNKNAVGLKKIISVFLALNYLLINVVDKCS